MIKSVSFVKVNKFILDEPVRYELCSRCANLVRDMKNRTKSVPFSVDGAIAFLKLTKSEVAPPIRYQSSLNKLRQHIANKAGKNE